MPDSDNLTDTVEAMMSVGAEPTTPPPGLVKIGPGAQAALASPKPADPPHPELTPAQQAMRERFEKPVTINWYGMLLEVAPYRKWGFQAQWHASRGDDVGVVTAIFGEDQMAKIMASEHATLDTIGELMQAIQQYYGMPGK